MRSKSSGSSRPTSNRRGRLIVISAPSGSGKTTLIGNLLRVEPGLARSVSATTRPPRPGERHGRDYRFVRRDQFLRARARGEFLECARILGHWYGTPRGPIRRALREGRDILLGVDIQGARQIRRNGWPAASIFLLPPSFKTLRERLERRGTETRDQINQRLRLARREMKELKHYDYAVLNDSMAEAVATVRAILKAERHRIGG